MRTASPVLDAERYWGERYGIEAVLCYCDSCGGEIYKGSGIYEPDEYWLTPEGDTIHLREECMVKHIKAMGQAHGGARV